MNPILIDSHAHIYLNEFKDDIELIIEKSVSNNISKILMPNINLETVAENLKLSSSFDRVCYSMLGLHPCYIKKNYKEEIQKIFKNFNDKIIAIGEIGIDLFRNNKNYNDQVDALKIQCEFAIKNKLPVVIHTRNSIDETIEIIRSFKNKDLKGVFHCFVGNYNQANKIIDLGFKLGIGGILTFKNSDLKETISKIDIKNLILETDSPYLSPEPLRGKTNNPSNLIIIAKKLAEINSIPLDVVCQVTSENTSNLFSLNS